MKRKKYEDLMAEWLRLRNKEEPTFEDIKKANKLVVRMEEMKRTLSGNKKL